MPHNFTLSEIEGTLFAFVLLSLFVVIPGFVLGALLNVLAFNGRTLSAKLAISISLSIAVVPIATYLWWLSVPSIPWLPCALSWITLPVILFRTRHRRSPQRPQISKQRIIVLVVLAAWIVFGALCLIDIQIGRRLFVPIVSYDYMTRTAFTAAIARSGVPPTNPYFYPGRGYILHYHYFWYMLCGLVARLGGAIVTGRIAVIAGTLWSGIGLAAIVAVYVHCFQSKSSGNRDRQMLSAVALLSISGLDILPLAATLVLSGRLNASSEWWNELILSWVNSVFWQPHSVAALVACTAGLLMIRDGIGCTKWPARLSRAAIGGAAFASGIGLSIYVTFTFGIFLVVWFVTLLLRRNRVESALMATAGLFAGALSLPYVLELARNTPAISGIPKLPIEFAIRSFYFAEALVGSGNPRHTALANALSLPLNYFLEFGFFFAAGILQWKKLRRQDRVSDEDACLAVMLVSSVLVCSFLRSNSLSSNDLGWRGIIVAQFVLLIWGAELWGSSVFSRRKTPLVIAMAALGLSATVYDVTMLRLYPILLDNLEIPRYHWLAPDHQLGERTYALRQVYEKLKSELPADAIVQQNPNASPGDLFYGLYADRQTAAETPSCGVVFGGSTVLCGSIINPIDGLFNQPGNLDSSYVDLVCRNLSISALVVKDTDTVWKDKSSWVWKKEPLIGNRYARAFLCVNR